MAILRRSDVIKVVKDWKDGKLQNEYVTEELNAITNNKVWYNNTTSKAIEENSLAYVERVSFKDKVYEDAYSSYHDGLAYVDLRRIKDEDNEKQFVVVPKTIEPHACVMAPDWSVFVATVLLDESFDENDKENMRATNYIAPSDGKYAYLPPTFITTKSTQAEYDILGMSKPPRKTKYEKCVMTLLKRTSVASGSGVKEAIVETKVSIDKDKKFTAKLGDKEITVFSPLSASGDIFDEGTAILIARDADTDDWIVVNAEC